jgi:hypothetical protein
MTDTLKSFLLASATALAFTVSALAFDGYRLESVINVESKGSSWDYVTYDAVKNHLYVGHRKEGLRVFDMTAKTQLKVVDQTLGSNSATLMPEFDLGVSNNEDGTITAFKMSTFEATAPVKIGKEVDTSHYDTFSKRLFVNMAGEGAASDLIVIDVPSLKVAGTMKMPSGKLEHAVADGKGNLYLAARDTNVVFTIDTKAMKVTAERKAEGCEQANSIDIDTANGKLFIACRGKGAVPPMLAVMDIESGKTVFKGEIGGGNDGVIYDAASKRIITLNGVSANMVIFEQVDANTYKMTEALGTRPGARSIGYDSKTRKVHTVTAEGSADGAKKILTSVSPFYANTFFPNTFVVLTYAPK